ncbi:MAG TPA: S8 family serine peptidase [Symbiobacteriaceae bacterium]|nr:S8 family serine peptidase [Symbiobacteriaceae bacterium]
MSLGSDESSDGTDTLSRAINAAAEAGIVVVVSAGNSGNDNYTIGAPAAAERAISMGAAQVKNATQS